VIANTILFCLCKLVIIYAWSPRV